MSNIIFRFLKFILRFFLRVFCCPCFSLKKRMKGEKKGHSNSNYRSNFEFKGMVDVGTNIHYDFRTRKSEKDETSEIRVISYNIEMGMELEGIIQDLKAVDADILLLQELDVGTKRIGYFDSGLEIAQQLGLNYVFSCRKHIDGGYEGNGVMTKFDIVDFSNIHFNCYHSQKKHPKGHFCPAPVIRIGSMNVKVTSLHLDPFRCGKKNRIKQINEVIHLIKNNKRSITNTEVIPKKKENINIKKKKKEEEEEIPEDFEEEEEEDLEEEEELKKYDCSIIAGDFNTACTGLARIFYPELSPDFSSVVGSLFYRTEAQVMEQELLSNNGYTDPFYKGACGFKFWIKDRTCKIGKSDWLYSSKLDWILLQDGKFEIINKKVIQKGHSDHMLVLVDIMFSGYSSSSSSSTNEDKEESEEEEEYVEFVLDEDKQEWVGKEKKD